MSGEPPAAAVLEIAGISWPEVHPGDDIAALLLAHADLRDGDVVALTSKVVSKAEGRAVGTARAEAVAQEAVRVLARRGDSVIAETRHGLVLAAAGVDSSNVAPGTSLLLPVDPDGSARRTRESILAASGINIGVVITDTAGRAWRNGQVDLAIGCAGLAALSDLSGTTDTHGNVLVVTAPATADEIASAGDLVKGKALGRPVAVLRGLAHLVLAAGQHGRGAAELIRPSTLDLFGLGAREAVVAAALRTDQAALSHFPPATPVDSPPFEGLVSDDDAVRIEVLDTGAGWRVRLLVRRDAPRSATFYAGRLWERCAVVAAAYRLVEDRVSPSERATADDTGWHTITSAHWS